jgi:hypothetical protein
VSAPAPERALRLSLIAWGLGDLSIGRRRAGIAWLALEVLMVAMVVVTTLLWADTTWYLMPFLAGVAFLVAWAMQAVLAYRRARLLRAASPAAPPRSPAAIVAWLTVPLLAWGTGFWLIAADGTSPSAAVDDFVTGWPEVEMQRAVISPASGDDIDRVAGVALANLGQLCALGRLADDCGTDTRNLLRDVRVSITSTDETHATAVAELVRFERFPSTFLGIFESADLRPVPIETVLTLDLEAQPAALGARRWAIVNARAG